MLLVFFYINFYRFYILQNLQRNGHGRGWVDIQDKPVFGEDKRFYYMRLPLADGKAGYFKHVAMINTSVSNKLFHCLNYAEISSHKMIDLDTIWVQYNSIQ